jgi:poly(A) polymerase Pap1
MSVKMCIPKTSLLFLPKYWRMTLITPAFATAWAASQRIYNPANSGEKVAQVVGGEIAANIHDKKNPWKILVPFA